MDYSPRINLLLEVLAYFGRCAEQHTPADILERLYNRGVTGLDDFRKKFQTFSDLTDRLGQHIAIPEEKLRRLFGNIPGFAYNTIGSCSPAFLLLYSAVGEYDGDFPGLMQKLRRRSPGRLAYDLASALGIAEGHSSGADFSGDDLTAGVLSLSVPAESKVALLDLYHNPGAVLEEAGVYLMLAMEALKLEEPALRTLTEGFSSELAKLGLEHFLDTTSALSSQQSLNYEIHPFIFGLDTNLSLDSGNPIQMYCGIYRYSLQMLLSNTDAPEQGVYQAVKLLGDQTRFDILCYLRDREAYGQELSDKFGLSRNTIHHHMTKLMAARLVSCTVDGNRVYYTINRDSVRQMLDQAGQLLLGDPGRK